MSGTFGYELDVNKMTEEEKTIVKAQIREFKEYYDLIQYGDYYRLTDPNKVEAYHGWEFAAPDGSEALLCIVALQIHPNGPGRWMCLKGLKADSVYLVHGQKYPGDALMNGGRLPEHRPAAGGTAGPHYAHPLNIQLYIRQKEVPPP